MVIHVGVLRLALAIPGARSLKDKRQVIASLRDRVRHRFDVTWHEVGQLDAPARSEIVCTTAGNDARVVRSALERVQSFVGQGGSAGITWVDLDVFPWHPQDAPWHIEEWRDE